MAGDPSLTLALHMSGGISNQVADLSLGGAVSNFRTWSGGTRTVTANAAAGATRLYVTSVATGMVFSTIVIRDGSAGGFYSPVTDADDVSDWIDLLEPLPYSAAIGDTVAEYRSVAGNMPFGVATAEECALGTTQYFGGYIEGPGAGTLNGFGVYIDEFSPGPWTIEVAVGSDPTPPLLPTIPDRFTAPDLANLMGTGQRGSFVRPVSYSIRAPNFNWNTTSGWIPMWIKATLPPNSLRGSRQVIALVAADDATLRAPIVLHLGTEGFTPDLTLKQSPSIYIRGGARFRANVKAAETDLAVEGVPVAMRQVSGPGTFYPPAAPAETDEDGNVVGHYTAPTDVGEIGQTIEIEAEV